MKRKVDFDPAELRASLDRIKKGEDGENPFPEFDRQIAKDVRDEMVHGRRIEDYRQALEHHGFTYVAREKMIPFLGKNGPHMATEGRWYNFRDAMVTPSLRMAITSDQICAWFPGGPQEFDEWYRDQKARKEAAQAGLVLPPSGLLVRS